MRQRVRIWIPVVLFWTLLALIYAGQMGLMTPAPSARVFRAQVTWQSLYYVAWAPLTLLIWRFTRTWTPDRLGWPRTLLLHLFGAVVVSTAQTAIVVALALKLIPWITEGFGVMFYGQLRARSHLQLLIYVSVVGTGQAITFYNQFRERQVAAARLEAQLAEARLDTLRAQLQPHFLFNSLHSIASLARTGDNAGVVRLISGFSDLLRHLLDSRQTHHTVREELTLVDRYLDLQRVRFGDRLRVRIHATAEAAAARVPLLVVQPLVENALRHGLAPRIEAGSVTVNATREGDELLIVVEDDGVGLPASWPGRGTGTGLRNLASRLEAEFGDRQSFRLEPASPRGARAVVRLPYTAA